MTFLERRDFLLGLFFVCRGRFRILHYVQNDNDAASLRAKPLGEMTTVCDYHSHKGKAWGLSIINYKGDGGEDKHNAAAYNVVDGEKGKIA